MAASIPRLFCGVALLLLGPAATQAAAPSTSLPIDVEAASSDFDYRNGVLVFRRVRITQGESSVEADRATATGLEFEDSRWQFEGNVRFQADGGQLASDAATVRFVANEITGAEVTGQPATFSQTRGERLAQGRAERIDYDLATGRVRLSGNAWLSDGRNEITGSMLVYSMRDERVLAEAGDQGGQPVRITINPKSPPGDGPPPP